ncbi:MAG: branched-chain amino acid ABC transporter permease [Sphingomonadaceae bacterium]
MTQQDAKLVGQTGPGVSRLHPTEKLEARRNPLKIVALAALALFLLVYPLVFTMPFHQHIAILVFVNALMAVGWNILGGYTGQVSLGNTIFFGVGAYASTILLKDYLISPWLGMLAGILLSILLAAAVGYPCFRLQGHYFAIATIAVGEILYTAVINTQELGAAVGIQIPLLPEAWINMQFHDKAPYYYISLAFLAIAMLVVYWIEHSRLGYYFRAIKEDQDGARALGINPTNYKLIAFILSAIFTSMAGTFYAQYVTFIDPYSTIYLMVSITMCLMAVLGGLGTLWGPVIGAVVLIGISESTRVLLGGTGKAIDLLIYGFLVIAFAVYQPNGLMGLLKSLRRRK